MHAAQSGPVCPSAHEASPVPAPAPSAGRFSGYEPPKEETPRQQGGGAFSGPGVNHPPDDLIDDLSEEELL